jgi:gluconolactonase
MATLTSPFVAHHPAFAEVTGDRPSLRRVATTDAHEGPVHAAGEHALYFTTVPRGRRVAIRRLDLVSGRVTTVSEPARMANGMAPAGDGRLLVCEQGDLDHPAAIAAVDPRSGAREELVAAWRGEPLNSPNDVVARRDGSVWFTDPSYGHLQGFRPAPVLGERVYRLVVSTGELEPVADHFDKPNGLAFSPDEHVLYVGDSGDPRHVLAHDVLDGRRLGPPRVFALITPGFPDGLKVDAAGRVYVSSASGVQVFAPDGRPLGEIAVPGAVNFTFAGRDLLITADTAIWAARLRATGPRPGD